MKIRLLFAFVCLSFVSLTANAQTPKPSPQPSPTDAVDDGDVVRVTSNLVVGPVSVLDKSGQPIQGLKISDFQLEENGRKQEIAQIGDPDDVPLDIALLIDVSSSVDSRFDFEKQAASRFLKEILKPKDRATVWVIDNKPRMEQPLGSVELAIEKLLNVTPAKSFTAFYDTVNAASRYLAKNTPSNHRRIIVVISDGEEIAKLYEFIKTRDRNFDKLSDEQKRKAALEDQRIGLKKMMEETTQEVQKADASFYSINPSGAILHLNLSAARSQEAMKTIADTTGGTSFLPNTDEDLSKVFSQLAAELRGQYLLQYYSNDESPEGKYIKISVRVPSKSDIKVRSRVGYYKRNS
jgi:Ca-activated chloride channel family protein